MRLWPVILVQQTVFAAFRSASNNQPSQFVGNVDAGHKKVSAR